MAKLVDMSINNRIFKVADIKKDYILNIINLAKVCPKIEKIYLFGSSIEERCTDKSDIDIAVFGSLNYNKMYQLKSFKTFCTEVINYFYTKENWQDYDYLQDYDILYFKLGEEEGNKLLLNNIYNGLLIYEKGDIG